MSIYDDPAAVASILQGAINAAEEHGQDGERIGLDVLRAAVCHLRLIDRQDDEDIPDMDPDDLPSGKAFGFDQDAQRDGEVTGGE